MEWSRVESPGFAHRPRPRRAGDRPLRDRRPREPDRRPVRHRDDRCLGEGASGDDARRDARRGRRGRARWYVALGSALLSLLVFIKPPGLYLQATVAPFLVLDGVAALVLATYWLDVVALRIAPQAGRRRAARRAVPPGARDRRVDAPRFAQSEDRSLPGAPAGRTRRSSPANRSTSRGSSTRFETFQNKDTLDAYTYLPFGACLTTVAYVLTHDIRWADLVAQLAGASLLWVAARRMAPEGASPRRAAWADSDRADLSLPPARPVRARRGVDRAARDSVPRRVRSARPRAKTHAGERVPRVLLRDEAAPVPVCAVPRARARRGDRRSRGRGGRGGGDDHPVRHSLAVQPVPRRFRGADPQPVPLRRALDPRGAVPHRNRPADVGRVPRGARADRLAAADAAHAACAAPRGERFVQPVLRARAAGVLQLLLPARRDGALRERRRSGSEEPRRLSRSRERGRGRSPAPASPIATRAPSSTPTRRRARSARGRASRTPGSTPARARCSSKTARSSG